MTLAVDDAPLRAVEAWDREVAAAGVEAVGVAQALRGPVLHRHRDMAVRGVGEIDGRVGGKQVAGLGIREEDVLRLRVCAEGLDQAPGEGAGAAADAVPVREAVDGDRDREQRDCDRSEAVAMEVYTYITSFSEASNRTDQQRNQPTDEREPSRPGGRRPAKVVAEVAGIRMLEDDPGGERKRDREHAEQPGEDRCALCDGVRIRDEADQTASAKCGKTNGTSVSAKIAREPPSTQAAHRRVRAK